MAEIEIAIDTRNLKKFLILGFLIIIFALELGITFTNPIAFGDEGFHTSTAKYIGTEVDYSKYTPLYGSTLNPEKFGRPPFWNLIEASFYFLFGFSETFVKFLVPFLSFMTGLVIYVFGKKLYSENLAIIAAAIAVTIPSFVTYSVLFYTVVPYIFFFSIAFLSLLTAIKTGSRKFWVLAGIFSGISVLANIAGLFMPIFTVVMGILHLIKTRNMNGFLQALKTYGLVILVTLLVMSPWVARNIGLFWVPGCYNPIDVIEGVCREGEIYQTVTGNQFAGRSSGGGTEESVLNIGVANYLQFAYGFQGESVRLVTQVVNNANVGTYLPWFFAVIAFAIVYTAFKKIRPKEGGVDLINIVVPVIAALIVGLLGPMTVNFLIQNGTFNLIGLAFVPFSFLAGLVVLARRKEFSDIALIVAAAIFLAVFYQLGGLFEGRSEDTARYFLSAVPLIGIVSATYWSSIKKDEHKLNSLIVLTVIIVILVLSFINFYSKLAQMDSVKNFIPSFFQACDWVKQNPDEVPKDANMLSLHTYPTRYNCERGAVWETSDKADILLSNDLNLVKSRLAANGIDFIFVQKFSLSNTPLGQAYPVSFVDFLNSNNQTFKKIYENGPPYGTQEFVNCLNSGGCDLGTIIYKVENN